jgi:hypothetical protein
MPSPLCTINGSAAAGGVTVAAGATVTIQLVDLSAMAWSLTVVGTDESQTAPTLAINQTTKTATFTAGALGSNVILKSIVNNGTTNGQPDASLSTTLGVYTLAANGKRVLAFGETQEGSALYGWTSTVNAILRARAGVYTYTFPSDANQTLPAAAYGCRVLRIAGSITATRNLVLPLAGDDLWFSVHNTTGQSVQFIGASGTGVTVATVTKASIYTDGTNWY